MMTERTILAVRKADIVSFPGHSRPHPLIRKKAAKMLKEEEGKLLNDSFVTHCGDDTELIMTPTRGEDSMEEHRQNAKAYLLSCKSDCNTEA